MLEYWGLWNHRWCYSLFVDRRGRAWALVAVRRSWWWVLVANRRWSWWALVAFRGGCEKRGQ